MVTEFKVGDKTFIAVWRTKMLGTAIDPIAEKAWEIENRDGKIIFFEYLGHVDTEIVGGQHITKYRK